MTAHPGLGRATPLHDLLDNYRVLLAELPGVIHRHPAAVVVRNQVGNLSIVVEHDGVIDYWGWIDVHTGAIVLRDEPWPLETDPPDAERATGGGSRP